MKGSPALNFREWGEFQIIIHHLRSMYRVLNQGSQVLPSKKGEKGEKASVIKMEKDVSMSMVSSEMNSSISSVGVNESALAGMDSDVSVDFRKRKNFNK